MKELDKNLEELVGIFYKPLVVYPGGWHDTLPEWIKNEIPIQRMAYQMLKYKGKEKEGRATNVEALAYLYTASLSGPMPDEYSEIYMYLTRKSLEWQGKKEIPEFLQEYEKLDDYEMSLLDELKSEIWNAQEKAYKERLKVEKREEREKGKENYFKQMKLF